MKVSYNWLKSYLDFSLTPEELSELLTDTGLEVEKLEKFESLPGGLKGVVIGEITEIRPHPNADKLQITRVNVGTPPELDIVCGAPNIAEGQKVFVATVGTVLYPKPDESFKIKKAKIRGEASFGMICSESELGLGDSHDGIMVLPKDAKAGLAAADYLELSTDYIFDIGLTPNRTDAFGHFGVARDIAARLSLKKKVRAELPELKPLKSNSEEPKITVEIRDADGCGRYAGLLIEGLTVQPSPDWLKNRLRSIGLNPVNAVVDITNFVQYETGQPLHAFDAAKIDGNKVIVDTLTQGTAFTTLDGEDRKLHESDLMICNEKGGMCIAGVFGGINSGVGLETTGVFLESAWFNPVRVRKTAKRHGLNTDASFRFERGVDPEQTLYALRRAADLILEISGGAITGPMIDEKKETPKAVELNFSVAKLNKLTGLKLSTTRVKEILDSLDFEILGERDDELQLRVPTYRVDVTRDVDVVEEVLRIYGYNAVELPERMSLSVSIEKKPERNEVIQTLCTSLVGRGFNEMMSNGLTRSDFILKVSESEYKNSLVPMLNPLSQELDVLRPTLVVSALETVAHNLNRQSERLRLFEVGKAYSKSEDGFSESTRLSIVQVGSRFPENWNNPAGELELSELLGNLNAVFEMLGQEMKTGEGVEHPFYQNPIPVILGSKQVGTAGQVGQKALKVYGIKKPVWVAEINLDACLKKVKHAAKQLTDLPKFPSVRRDLSLLLDEKVEFGEIERIARKKGGSLMQEVGLFDVYEGKNLPEGKKSYAVSFILQDKNKTLADKQIDQVMGQIQKELESSLGASLR